MLKGRDRHASGDDLRGGVAPLRADQDRRAAMAPAMAMAAQWAAFSYSAGSALIVDDIAAAGRLRAMSGLPIRNLQKKCRQTGSIRSGGMKDSPWAGGATS